VRRTLDTLRCKAYDETRTTRERSGTSRWEPKSGLEAIDGVSNVPTVYLLGEEHLPLISEYLQLGSVVVVAPDRDLLTRWTAQQGGGRVAEPPVRRVSNLVIDLDARRATIHDRPVPLSDLEFRVLAALLARPGRAWSFGDLRTVGWGEGPAIYGDPQTVRALVQRLRKKLDAAGAQVCVEAVRSFGFRAEPSRSTEGLSLTGVAMPPAASGTESQAC
jgi:two-component system response regulator MtrA